MAINDQKDTKVSDQAKKDQNYNTPLNSKAQAEVEILGKVKAWETWSLPLRIYILYYS